MVMEIATSVFHTGITVIIHLLELMGVAIILFGAVRDFFWYFTGKTTNIRLDLAQSMALGLEFKLGGEILRTVVARNLYDLFTVGVIIALRAALNFLIHWEISHIEQDEAVLREQKQREDAQEEPPHPPRRLNRRSP